MRAIRLTPLNRLRKTLDGHISTGVVVLAGAGVSMVPPTSLPSGDALRDHCVRCLLSDPTSRKVVQLLLHTPAFRAFLPEAVLQLMGSTVGSRLDLFIKKVLSSAAPNVVHKALVARGYRIFTTNFDTCFEAAGGVNTRHLHGSILRLDTLQNQLYRLGKTALQETKLFARAVSGKVLLVLGYSFRDDDIVKLVESNVGSFM